LDSFLIGLLSYQTSVGGDPSRKDVSFFSVTAQINSFWGQRWWTVVQSIWQVDFERSGKSSMVMEFEGGRNLIGRFGAYVRPGVGIYGRDVAGAYIWNIEVGVRYMFASF
jgi:D-mannonate dehydratase